MGAERVAATAVAVALLLAAGCASVTTPSAGNALPSNDAAQARALAHFAQGLVFEWEETPDLEAALRAYQNAMSEDPSDPDLRNMAARALLDLKRPEQAQAVLEKAVRDMPRSPSTRLALGRVAASRGNHTLAVREFQAAAKYASTPVERIEALLLAAYASFLQGSDADVLKQLDAVAAYPPDALADPDAEGEAALPPRIRAIRFALELAELRLDDGCGDAAQPYPVWAANRATNHLERADVWERFGATALRKKQPEIAAAALRQAARSDALRTRAILMAIALERKTKVRDVTAAVLTESVSTDPANAALRIALARMLADRDQHTEALAHVVAATATLRANSPTAPLPGELWLLHGSMLERSRKLAAAETVFRQSLVEHPDFAPIQNYLAYMLAEQARALDEAERLVLAALKTEPDNAAFLDTLGWVHYQAGRYQESLVWLLRAAEDEVQDATILDHIGDALEKLGRKPESASYWSMSYRLNPDDQAVAAKLTGMGIDLTRLLPVADDGTKNEAVEGDDESDLGAAD
jgi:tetratricopeptide (TPR) repeat protein